MPSSVSAKPALLRACIDTFLGRFLLNNYVQALVNVESLSVALERAKTTLRIPSDSVFEQWQKEELSYLLSLKKTPEGDLLALKYVETMKLLKAAM